MIKLIRKIARAFTHKRPMLKLKPEERLWVFVMKGQAKEDRI